MLSKVLSPNYVTLQVDSFSTHECVQVVCVALPDALIRDVMLGVEVRGSLVKPEQAQCPHTSTGVEGFCASQLSIGYEHEHMRQITFPLAIRQIRVSFAYLASQSANVFQNSASS